MDKKAAPRVLILAGPNGAGKTTFAREFLPHEADCPVFVNADLIATRVDAWALYDNAGTEPVLLDWSDAHE